MAELRGDVLVLGRTTTELGDIYPAYKVPLQDLHYLASTDPADRDAPAIVAVREGDSYLLLRIEESERALRAVLEAR